MVYAVTDKRLVVSITAMLLWLAAALFASGALAQPGLPVQWSDPIQLAIGLDGNSETPTIVSDEAGGLHIFWRQITQSEGGMSSLLYYMHWDGENWSAPVDVIRPVRPNNPAEGFPSVGVTTGLDSQIHVVWDSVDGIYHSQASILDPTTAQAWSLPEQFVDGNAREPSLVILPDGSLHVAFLRLDGVAGIYYTGSDDGGRSWSPQVLVSEAYQPRNLPQTWGDVYLLADDQDVLHVVWVDQLTNPESNFGGGIYYARSTDRGSSWSLPYRIDEDWDTLELTGTERNKLASLGFADGNLHVLWSASYPDEASCARQERISTDGGATWERRTRILVPLEGCIGWMDMAADSAETLHLVTVARDGLAISQGGQTNLYHSQLNGGDWSRPLQIRDVGGPTSEWSNTGVDRTRIAVSEGNLLNVVWFTAVGQLWFVQGTSDAAPVPRAARQEIVGPPAVAAATGQLAAATPTWTPTPPSVAPGISDINRAPQRRPTGDPLLLGVLPALALVIVVVIAARRRAHA